MRAVAVAIGLAPLSPLIPCPVPIDGAKRFVSFKFISDLVLSGAFKHFEQF